MEICAEDNCVDEGPCHQVLLAWSAGCVSFRWYCFYIKGILIAKQAQTVDRCDIDGNFLYAALPGLLLVLGRPVRTMARKFLLIIMCKKLLACVWQRSKLCKIKIEFLNVWYNQGFLQFNDFLHTLSHSCTTSMLIYHFSTAGDCSGAQAANPVAVPTRNFVLPIVDGS